MKKSLLIVLVLVMLLGVIAGTSLADDAKPVVTVASNVTIPFLIYYDDDGAVVGYEAMVYQEALKRAGYDVEIVDVDFAGIIPGLLSEKWDVACSNIFITKERYEKVDFTEPFVEGWDAAVAREDSGIKTLADFKGHVIGSETGTTQAQWLVRLQEQYGPFEIRGYDNQETQFMDLEIGRIDAVTTGYNTAVQYPQYPMVGVSDDNAMIGCAIRKEDTALKEAFDTALREMKEDGTTAKLYEEYYGIPAPENSAVTRVFDEPYVP